MKELLQNTRSHLGEPKRKCFAESLSSSFNHEDSNVLLSFV